MKVLNAVIIFLLTGGSCSLEYPPGYFERINEAEQNWSYCYNNRFVFPEEDAVGCLFAPYPLKRGKTYPGSHTQYPGNTPAKKFICVAIQ